MRSIINDKKGVSLATWSEATVGILLIMLCLVVIVTQMNAKYGESFDSTFGMSSESTKASIEEYQSTLETGLAGDASTDSISGISLSTSWGMINAGIRMILDFVTGGWVYNAVMLLQWGQAGVYLAWALRLTFIFSLIWILLRILFKVNP